MRALRGVSILFALFLADAQVSYERAEAAAAPTTFPVGSLILPTTSAYQDDCGAVSVYGLVYDVLRANYYLVNTLHTTPINVNYIILDTKGSPNRCEPTNLNSNPAPVADPSWTDGCDIRMAGAAPLVKLVNNTSTAATNDSNISTISTTGNTTIFPTYGSVNASSAAQVNYGGGPFVISVGDAPNFLGLLDGTIAATDSSGNAIDFTPFRSNKGSCTYGNTHYVNIHRAETGFNAVISNTFTSQPPRLALLEEDTGSNTKNIANTSGFPTPISTGSEAGTTATITTSFATGLGAGGTVTISGASVSGYNGIFTVNTIISSTKFTVTLASSGLGSISNGTVLNGTAILPSYLINAGLGFVGAQGCPTGGLNVANTGLCPNGSAAGQIYDALDFMDLVNNLLTIKDGGVQRYHMLWMPHWETKAGSNTLPTANEQKAFQNIAAFATAANGLLAECASISALEGAYDNNTTTKFAETQPSTGVQFQTCVGSNSVCTAGTTNYGMFKNNGNSLPPFFGGTVSLPNCTDLTTGTNSSCVVYGVPADPYAQVGDYMWSDQIGTVGGFQAMTGSTFRPGVQALLAVKSKQSDTTLHQYYLTRNLKDNTPGESNIVYLAGHDQTQQVAGTKVALQTLLQLGTDSSPIPTTTTETSRSNPILGTIDGASALVTAAFNNVQPGPVPAAIADVGIPPCGSAGFPGACLGSASAPAFASWIFPYVVGHIHASPTASGFTQGNATSIGGTADLLHAGLIPAVTSTSCRTSGLDTTSRTIFTTTTVPSILTGLAFTNNTTPLTLTPFCDANAGTLAPLMLAGMTPANNTTLVDHVLAGYPNAGSFIPAFGGVDHSTVAVIGPGTVVGSTRPTMVYFGGLDGMLHAVCGDNSVGVCTNNIGQELWAFAPRSQLVGIPTNTARIDGSPHVIDAFGNFGTASKSFHTILTFQTASGNPMSAANPQPAVYALNIDDPANPTVLWEYTVPVPGTPALFEVGNGQTVMSGPISLGGVTKYITVIASANGNIASLGVRVVALDLETGSPLWTFTHPYVDHVIGDDLIPATGIVGGAVAIDKTGQGFFTDVVFADLLGEVWQLDITNGTSRYKVAGLDAPLFQFASDYHPLGAAPAVYSNGSKLFAAFVSGGFSDPADNVANKWESAAVTQDLVSVSLSPSVAPTLTDTSITTPDGFVLPLGAGEHGFAQVHVSGDQLLIADDTSDVNNSSYGTTGATGKAYSVDFSATPSLVAISMATGGASSIATSTATGTGLYTASANKQELIGQDNGTTGVSVTPQAIAKVTRNLWLRTE